MTNSNEQPPEVTKDTSIMSLLLGDAKRFDWDAGNWDEKLAQSGLPMEIIEQLVSNWELFCRGISRYRDFGQSSGTTL